MKKLLLTTFFAALLLLNLNSVSAQYISPVYILPVPSITAPIVIDGDADASYTDWQVAKIAKEAGAGVTPHDGDATDFNVRFKLTWDWTYLYLIADIVDDIEEDYVIGKTQPWTWDNVEIFIDLDTNSTTQAYSTTSTTQIRFCRGLLDANGDDSLVESNSRGAGGSDADSKTAQIKQFKFYEDAHATIDNGTGWHFEVAIPWSAATDSASVDIHDLTVVDGGTVVGFDLSVADADGDGTGDTGGRNVAGGAQAFWDLDDPEGTGNEDNAYQNRLVFGFIQLLSVWWNINYTGIASNVCISPNPAHNQLTLSGLYGNRSAIITDLLGQTVRSMEITNDKTTIDISDLAAGIYFFRPDNAVYAIKFIKQ